MEMSGVIYPLSRLRYSFQMQESLHPASVTWKNAAENATKLVEAISSPKTPNTFSKQQEIKPKNAREWEWGLYNKESARKAYYRVACHTHYKLQLVSKGFLISKSKPFLGDSVDNIQKCFF